MLSFQNLLWVNCLIFKKDCVHEKIPRVFTYTYISYFKMSWYSRSLSLTQKHLHHALLRIWGTLCNRRFLSNSLDCLLNEFIALFQICIAKLEAINKVEFRDNFFGPSTLNIWKLEWLWIMLLLRSPNTKITIQYYSYSTILYDRSYTSDSLPQSTVYTYEKSLSMTCRQVQSVC